jgi:hypothetical protein
MPKHPWVCKLDVSASGACDELQSAVVSNPSSCCSAVSSAQAAFGEVVDAVTEAMRQQLRRIA